MNLKELMSPESQLYTSYHIEEIRSWMFVFHGVCVFNVENSL